MRNKKIFTRIIVYVLLAALALAVFSACTANEAENNVEWLSPMLSISVAAREASAFTGEQLIVIDTNDFGRENRGKVVTGIPEEGQPVVAAQLSGANLEARGAVKITANFAYEGNEVYPVRFRVRVDRFQGHSITTYGLAATAGVLVLWEDENGTWWNIRRTGWGGEFTGGTNAPGWYYPENHATLAGQPYPVFTFAIDKETAKNFATQDFYIVFLEAVPLRTNHVGVVIDETSGYVITYQAELPDGDGHFHNFKVLASTSTYIHIPAR